MGKENGRERVIGKCIEREGERLRKITGREEKSVGGRGTMKKGGEM